MAQLEFEFVDGTREIVWPDSPRYRELLADGHAPVGSVPESDGISDQLEAYLAGAFTAVADGILDPQVAAAQAAQALAEDARDAALAVPTTTDALIAARVNDPASATTTALATAYVGVNETAPAIQRYYQPGDADYAAAFGRAIAAAPKALRVPESAASYDVSAGGFSIPPGMAVTIEEGAKVKATAAISGPIFTTPVGSKHDEGFFNCQGVIDCNNLADTGLYLRWFADFYVPRIDVRSPRSHAVIAGDPAATGTSYGLRLDDLYVRTPSGGRAVPAGSRGLWMQNAGDSRVAKGTVVGQDAGIRNDQGNNRFSRVHVWGFSGSQPSVCFDDNAFDTAFYESCMADTPATYGWRVRSSAFVSFLNCSVFNNSIYGSDNSVIGVHFDASNPVFGWVGGLIDGVSGHRLAKDFESSAGGISSGFYLPAKDSAWVVARSNPAGQQASMANLRLTGLLRSVFTGLNMSFSDGAGVSTMAVDSSVGSRRVSLNNAADLRVYSDTGTTLQYQVVGSNGSVRPGRCTTATRPTGGALVTGAIIFDTTIQRYVYHDGTNWKDMAGATV